MCVVETSGKKNRDDEDGIGGSIRSGHDAPRRHQGVRADRIALTKALSYVSLASGTKLDDDEAQKKRRPCSSYSINGNELTFFGLELADMPRNSWTSRWVHPS